MDLLNQMGCEGGQGLAVASCEHGNEALGSTKERIILLATWANIKTCNIFIELETV
jgi:hypothetical protein